MRYLPEIAGLRGVAAIYVLMFHIFLGFIRWGPGWPEGGAPPVYNFGWVGVDLFFVLSGFLLSLPFLERPEEWRTLRSWRTFWAKRWMRIAPAYYVSIVVSLLLIADLSYLVLHPVDILLHLTYLHSFFLGSFATINPVYWTLASEFHFYLLLPFLGLLFARKSWPWVLAAGLGFTLWWRWWTYPVEHGGGILPFTFPGFVAHFLLGIAAARLYLRGFRFPKRTALLAALSFLFLFVALPLLYFSPPGSVDQGQQTMASNLFLRPLLAVGFAGFILSVSAGDSGLRRFLATRPMQKLGTISYSVYLMHLPILMAASRWTAPADHGFPVFAAWGILIALVGSAVFYGLVERPFMSFRTRIFREPMTAASAAPPAKGSEAQATDARDAAEKPPRDSTES